MFFVDIYKLFFFCILLYVVSGSKSTTVTITGGSTSDSSSTRKVEIKEACGDVDTADDDAMEQEEMFVDAHESFEHQKREWGGPRRGGRLPEPTRFGDWERKGRCSDF
jgi:hypothetical protein